MPPPSTSRPRVSRLFQENPYISEDMLNISKEDLLRWQVADISVDTRNTIESSAIIGLNLSYDSAFGADMKLIKAWRSISPIYTIAIDEIIICCYQNTKEPSHLWFSIAMLLKHHTYEFMTTRLAQQDVYMRTFSSHPFSADTRPIISLFYEDCPSNQVIASDYTHQNFFKGLYYLLYDIKHSHPIYYLINKIFLLTEDNVPLKLDLLLTRHVPNIKQSTTRVNIFKFKKEYRTTYSSQKPIVIKFFEPSHGMAYHVNFFYMFISPYKKHETYYNSLLNLHYAIESYHYDLALQIVTKEPHKILQWNGESYEACHLLIQQDKCYLTKKIHTLARLTLLRKLLEIRRSLIKDHSKNEELFEIQIIWEFYLKQRHSCESTNDEILYLKNNDENDDPILHNLHDRLKERLRRPIHEDAMHSIIRNCMSNSEAWLKLDEGERALYKKPRSILHQLIIEYEASKKRFYGESSQYFYDASHQHFRAIELCIQTKPHYLNAKDIFGFTPLIIAVALGHLDIITLLIEHGADTQDYDFHGRRYSLLHNAPNEKVVKHLLYLGVSPHDGRLTLDQAWRHRDYDRIHHLLIYGMRFYQPKHGAIIMERFEDGTSMITHAIQAASEGSTRDLEYLYLLLIFFADFVYEGPYDAKIQNNSGIMSIIHNHNQRIYHERESKIHRVLSVQSVDPLMNPSRHVCGIRTRYHLINDPSYATGTIVETRIIPFRDLSKQEQLEIAQLYDKSFQPLPNTIDFIRQIITSDITKGPWIHALIEIGTIDGRIISGFIFSLRTYINEQGQLRRLFTGKVAFIDPYFSGLHLAESLLRIPLAIKMDKPQVSMVETHELLIPGFAIPAMKLTLSRPSPMYQLPISSSEKDNIFLCSQGTYAMSPQPVKSVIPASMQVKIQENYPRKAWFQLLALLPREETSPEKYAVVFVSLLDSYSPAFFARLHDCQRLGFTPTLLLKTARLLPAFFAYQEQLSLTDISISQKTLATL